ncbi:class I adenylate-forming enzyme family protein [Fodinicurvata halophila]|uniref:Class I adenylate-forming enzyme family protein n=1 Tax=Fodinicurvata halophila TaxID=1419723 RepID=A0ABV8UJN8_9PROT
MNPAEWLARTARNRPETPALFHGEEKLADYAGFNRKSASIGAYLRELGLGRGDRIAVVLPNCPEYLPVLYGIWYAGATAVPINAKLHAKEVAWILEDAGARLVFLQDAQALVATGSIRDDVDMIEPGSPRFTEMFDTPPLDWPESLGPEQIVWLFYTSGTTGRPKGAMLSGANLMAMSLSYLVDVDEVRPEDAALYATPMSHGAGLYNFVHVLRGARHVIPRSGGFDPTEILETAPRIGNISMFAAPTVVKRLAEVARQTGAGSDGIKTIVYGGGPMYVADIQQALDVFGPKFVQIYGQGESPMCITALSRADIADRGHPKWTKRLASVGRAQSVVEVRVVDAEGRPLPAGEVGEVTVRGTSVMQGYLGNPEANAKSLRDGWLWTGDLGQLDADGYLYLHDRAKDLVISGGSNIYPREVEEALLTHPGVQEVSVVGAPDPEWGEIVVAFVVAAEGTTPEPVALDAACSAEIARFKKPKKYVFVDELPKNNYGKVLKTELRKQLQEQEVR